MARSQVSLAERGHLERLRLPTLRRIAAALDIRIDLRARWRGGELDRLLDRHHAILQAGGARMVVAAGGWDVRPEVTFSIYGERGSIDLLCWHQARHAILVIEVKTQLVDLQDLLATLDRKARLAPRIAVDQGWGPVASVSRMVLLPDHRTCRRRVAEHAGLLRAALPTDGRGMRRWLRDPVGPVAALGFLPDVA